MSRPSHADVVAALAAHDPVVHDDHDEWEAAVAMIVADVPSGPELLFIERTRSPGDRWSGQMALPGGKRDATDPDLAATAMRETAEEVGIALGHPVGRLDDVVPRQRAGSRVAVFAHEVRGRPTTVPEAREVEACVWIPVAHLFDPANVVRHRYRMLGPFAGIEHEGRVVWGLTHGILRNLGDVLGLELPVPRGPLLG